MGNQKKPKTWRVQGRCLKINETGRFIEAEITLPELESGLGMRPSGSIAPTLSPNLPNNSGSSGFKGEIQPEYFGVPIDTKLAVDLIHKGFTKSEAALKMLENKNFDKENFDFIRDVINLNYGITFDKTVMLKILSQPNCAGLRAYLCARPVGIEDKHTSLVMVGVDINGFDLNYDYARDSASIKVPEIPNQSLIVEYGYPPGGTKSTFTDKAADTDEHYTLLKLAMEYVPEDEPKPVKP